MLTRTRIVFYWLLLLVPTVILGVWGWRLLAREEARLAEAESLARQERLSLAAENLDLFFEEVKGAVLEGLSGLPEEFAPAVLSAWSDGNPLVANAFIWRPGEALVYPDPNEPANDGEARFVNRYQDLFSDRDTWMSPELVIPQHMPEPEPSHEEAALPLSPRREVQMLAQQDRYAAVLRQRDSLPADSFSAEDGRGRALAAGEASRSQRPELGFDSESLGDVAMADRFSPPREGVVGSRMPPAGQGWIPWQGDEDDWSVLGWVRFRPGGQVHGAELDREHLLSRVRILLNGVASQREFLALINGDGATVAASDRESPEMEPDLVLPVGALFPDWRLAAYPPGNGILPGSGFFLVSLLLLGVFLAAILSGGSLLLWQAHRNALDARRKSGFVSNVSHELKTPLTTLRMYAELLETAPADSASRRERYLGVIRSETDRLTRLVNNVLDFSRLERKQKSFRPEVLDVGELLAEFVEKQRPRAEAAGLALTFEGDAGKELAVRADRDALEQVFLNLLDNAVKYAAAGGQLTVSAACEDGRVCLRFMDRGPGVLAAHRDRIFEEFHRVDGSLTAENPGCGLGLNIARQLARAMGGDLAYEPRPGGGSIFCLSFALLEP